MGKNNNGRNGNQQAAATTTDETVSITNKDVGDLSALGLDDAPSISGSTLSSLNPTTPAAPVVAQGEPDAAAVTPAVTSTPPVEPAVVTPKQPIAEPEPAIAPVAPAPVVPSTTVVIESNMPATGLPKAIVDELAAKVTGGTSNHLNTIVAYMENMKPRRPVNAVEGGRHQVSLYRALLGVINGPEEDFHLAFTTILRLFDDHGKGVFAESHVFRYFETMALGDIDRKVFQRLLNFLKIVAPVKGRETTSKLVDFVATFEPTVYSEEGRQRVMNYFNK